MAEDFAELSAIERVKGYVRMLRGKQVHVGGYTRKGDGPNHRALYSSLFDTGGALGRADFADELARRAEIQHPRTTMMGTPRKPKPTQAEITKWEKAKRSGPLIPKANPITALGEGSHKRKILQSAWDQGMPHTETAKVQEGYFKNTPREKWSAKGLMQTAMGAMPEPASGNAPKNTAALRADIAAEAAGRARDKARGEIEAGIDQRMHETMNRLRELNGGAASMSEGVHKIGGATYRKIGPNRWQAAEGAAGIELTDADIDAMIARMRGEGDYAKRRGLTYGTGPNDAFDTPLTERVRAARAERDVNSYLDRLQSAMMGGSGDTIDSLAALALKQMKDMNATGEHYKRLEQIIAKARFKG